MANWLESVIDWLFTRESPSLDSPPGVPQADYDAHIAAMPSSYDQTPLGRDIERIGLAPWSKADDSGPLAWDEKRRGLTGWRGGKMLDEPVQ